MLGTLYGVQMLNNQVKMLMEENPFTEKWYWREASMFNTLKCFIEVWAEKFEDCKTITEKKNFSLYIMEKIKEYNEILQKIEVKI
jgi:hypothetical protein